MTCELGCPKRAIYKGEERILVCSECYPRIEEALSEEARGVIQRLSDALEAADQRADQAEAELKDAYRTDIPSLKDQRDAAIKRAAELAAALEAAEQERDEARKAAEDHVLDADAVHVRLSAELREVNQERDALAAVVEKAEDYVTRHYLDTRFGDEVLPMLATAPADVLREHDAKVRAEALRDAASRANEWRAANGMHGGEWFPSKWAGQVAGWLEHRAAQIEREGQS